MDLGNRLCVRAEVKKLLLHRDTCPRQRPMISGKQGADAQARLFASTCPTGFFAALLPQGDAQRKRQVYAREELRAAIASLILGSELGIGYYSERHAGYVDHCIGVGAPEACSSDVR